MPAQEYSVDGAREAEVVAVVKAEETAAEVDSQAKEELLTGSGGVAIDALMGAAVSARVRALRARETELLTALFATRNEMSELLSQIEPLKGSPTLAEAPAAVDGTAAMRAPPSEARACALESRRGEAYEGGQAPRGGEEGGGQV